jgi:hypothetical protein
VLTGSGVLKAFGSGEGKLEAFCSGGGMNFVGDAIWLRNAAEDRDFEIASGRSKKKEGRLFAFCRGKKTKKEFRYRESNPGPLGENQKC